MTKQKEILAINAQRYKIEEWLPHPKNRFYFKAVFSQNQKKDHCALHDLLYRITDLSAA